MWNNQHQSCPEQHTPLPAPKNTNFSVGVFLFFVLNLCAVTTGEERKTVDNCFSRTKSTKQREMKQGYALSTFRLCDLTGHVELKTVCPKGTGVRIPLPAPIKMVYSLRVDLFLLPQSEGTNPKGSHTAGTQHTTRNRLFAVSASRGDIGLNLYRSGTIRTDLAPSSIPLFKRGF